MNESKEVCKSCGNRGSGTYCQTCGERLMVKRLTVKGLINEVFHYFTHLDKGFPNTLKKLVRTPGTMQRDYVEGVRGKFQKPFSMFFICATFAALALYWINITLVKYFNVDNSQEAQFFHRYWVLFQVIMFPVYTVITYLLFKGSRLNYAEIMVFQLYLFSFVFLMLTMIHLLKFIFPHLETRYIELPAIIIYTIITNLNFFHRKSKWITVIKSVVAIALCFWLASYLQDLLVNWIF